MLKVVLDTSVCVAALLSDSGASARILQAVMSHEIQSVTSPEILKEIRAVLSRSQFRLSKEKQHLFVRLLTDISLVMTPLVACRVVMCRDPQDDMFLSLAHQAGADYLISLDHDLIDMKIVGITKIVAPGNFLKRAESDG